MSRRRRRLPYNSGQGRERPFWQRISTAGWLFLGLILGLGVGLYYAWVVDPIIYVNAGPARLSQQYKMEYILLVSQSYALNDNWPLAEQRLAVLEDPNLSQTVNTVLESSVRELQSPEALRNLANLAQQLGAEGGAVAIFAPTADTLPTPTLAQPSTPTPPPATPTAQPSTTPTPLLTSTPTLAASPSTELLFRLLEQEQVCDPTAAALIEVITQDAFLDDLAGVEVQVEWELDRDRFFTGFKPEKGAGYGDFVMAPNTSYSVQLTAGSEVVSGLRIESCANGADGGWRLTFQRLRNAEN